MISFEFRDSKAYGRNGHFKAHSATTWRGVSGRSYLEIGSSRPGKTSPISISFMCLSDIDDMIRILTVLKDEMVAKGEVA